MTVTYKQYNDEKMAFFKRHGYDYKVSDGGMLNDTYHKDYIFEDDAVWTEVSRPTYEKGTVNIKGLDIEVEVKMLQTEYFSTESGSKYYYEKY